MMMLKNFSTEELMEELKRREEVLRDRPKQLSNPDWTKLVTICEECIDDFMKHGAITKKFDGKILDTALETIYGTDVLAWIEKAIG